MKKQCTPRYEGRHPCKMETKGRIPLKSLFAHRANPDEFPEITIICQEDFLPLIGFETENPPFDEAEMAALHPYSNSIALDPQGRSPALKKDFKNHLQAAPSRDIVLVGRGNYFEIWSKKNWVEEGKPHYDKQAADILKKEGIQPRTQSYH